MEKIYSSAIAGALARRTVHIKMHPTARTFTERREVLRVLERFGEVTMFRSYKYHPKNPVPNAFLSVFSNETAAQAVVNASPMRYRLVPNAAPSATPEAENNHMEQASDAGVIEEVGGQEKVFELNVSPSQFDHEHHIANEPLFGPWTPVDRKHSFFGGGLEIQRSLMSSGLRDWETDGRKWRNVWDDVDGTGAALEGLGVRNLGANGSGKDGVNTQWRVDQRRKKRLVDQLKEGVMGGLKRYNDQAAKEGDARTNDQRREPQKQEEDGQHRPNNIGFGSWPGKSFRAVMQEKEMQEKEMQEKEMQKAKAVEAGLNENRTGAWAVR